MSGERYMRLRGDGRHVNRYRVSEDDDSRVHLYLDVQGEHTVADLLNALAESGCAPQDVTFRGGTYVLTVPSTEDDRLGWRRADEESEERGRVSRRAWYERLRGEFEDAP